MAYLEEIERNGEKYYYAARNFRLSEGFRKIRVYFGKEKPSEEEFRRAGREIDAIAVGEGLIETQVTPVELVWFLSEELPNSNPLHSFFPIGAFTDFTEFGVSEHNILYCVLEGRQQTEYAYFPKQRFADTGKAIFRKLLADPSWGEWLNKEIIQRGWEYYWFAERLKSTDVTKSSNEELSFWYKQLSEKQRRSQTCGMPWNVMEFEEQYLTNYLTKQLGKALQGCKDQNVAQVFSLLTTPTERSFAQKETISLFFIASLIQSSEQATRLLTSELDSSLISKKLGEFAQLNKLFDQHYKDFCWLPYMYSGPAWKKEYFIEILSGIVKQNPDSSYLLKKAVEEQTDLEKKQFELKEKLGLDEKTLDLLDVAKQIVFTKGFRKDCLYHSFYCMEPLLVESSKRLGVSLEQLRRLAPWELVRGLSEGKVDKNELEQRSKHYLQYVEDGKIFVLSGKKAIDFMKKLSLEKQSHAKVSELNGQCACPGIARGVVKKINCATDMWKMHEGDVLVAHATSPDVVPAMKKASAIVTDMGGITCHAAIVSRELKIPCVIGTKIATKVLSDGVGIEVDATHGRIRLM